MYYIIMYSRVIEQELITTSFGVGESLKLFH